MRIHGWTADVKNENTATQATVCVQNLSEGTRVAKGAVVDITLLYQDAIA